MSDQREVAKDQRQEEEKPKSKNSTTSLCSHLFVDFVLLIKLCHLIKALPWSIHLDKITVPSLRYLGNWLPGSGVAGPRVSSIRS